MDRRTLHTICEAFLDETMELNDLPGLALGVCWRGEEFVGARGVRDIVSRDPLQPDDVFHCASLSKTFTSAAILQLADAGVLDLSDRLVDVLPEFLPKAGATAPVSTGAASPFAETGAMPYTTSDASLQEEGSSQEPQDLDTERLAITGASPIVDKRWEDVRIDQMLSHTAGIGDVTDYHWEEALTERETLADYVHSAEVMAQPLLWAPGEGGFRYSNIAYEILGHIVERKSADYAQARGAEEAVAADGRQEPVRDAAEASETNGRQESIRDAEEAAGMDGRQDLARGGRSYEAFIRDYLMAPAGMQDSTMLTFRRLGVAEGDVCPLITEEIRRRNAAVDDRASSSRRQDDWHPMALPHQKAADRSIQPVKYYPYNRSHAPSSTLTANVADLLRWCRAHLAGFAAAEGSQNAAGNEAALLTAAAYQRARREYAEVPNNREKMGLGWFMRRQGGYQLYGHEGSDDGFRASLWICPQLELGIVVLANLSEAPVKKINKKLFDILTAS